MGRTTAERPKNKVHHVFSLGAKLATAFAALATVLGYVHSVGLDGSTTRRTIGTFGAAWIGVTPSTDTAMALGDTLHLAATVTDKHGTALVGASMIWTSTDTTVASVVDGLVVARSPGAATIMVAVGDLLGRSMVVVRPRVAAVHLASDSSVVVPEGARHMLSMRAADSRGHPISDRTAIWHSSDTTVATVDSAGRVTGTGTGHATISATVDGVTEQVPITVNPVPGALAVIGGSGQDGPAGATLSTPLAVRVTSQRGRPLVGSLVRFRRVDGGATIDVAAVVTDVAGTARTPWRLGEFPGRQHVVASVEGLDSTAVAEAEAEPVASNTRSTIVHEGQIAPIATALPQRVAVRLADSSGRPLSDVPVSWSTVDGGTVKASSARTDSLGEVDATWVLGPVAGHQRVRAAIGNGRFVRPVMVHATALPGPATILASVSGGGQRALTGGALPKPIVLKVADAAGNAVPGVRIVLTPSAGALADTVVTTDSSGHAKARWTLPAAPANGTVHLSARVDGVLKPAVVTATIAPKPPSRPAAHPAARTHRHSS